MVFGNWFADILVVKVKLASDRKCVQKSSVPPRGQEEGIIDYRVYICASYCEAQITRALAADLRGVTTSELLCAGP